MTGAPLSALIVAHNEEDQLEACLQSCAFADEIVVVLDRCTDGSKAIAERRGAHIVEGAWPQEGDRRHAGIDACKGPWILEVDADERVPASLAAEIRKVLETAKPGCIQIPFDNYIGARHIRYGWGAYNGISVKWSLFWKGCKRWGNQRVHPSISIDGAHGRVSAAMTHYVDKDITDLFARLNRYSTHAAADLMAKGERPGRLTSLRRFFSRFFKSYVSRSGYREGYYGLALALFAGLYPLLTHLKIEEALDRRAGEGDAHHPR